LTGDEWSTWFAEADGSNPRLVAKGVDGTLSPDGRRLVYGGTTAQPHLFVRDLASGEDRDLGRMFFSAWSPDGSRLTIWDKTRLLVVDAKSGESREVARGTIFSSSFSRDGEAIIFGKGSSPTKAGIFVARLSDHRSTRLADGWLARWGKSWIAFSRARYLNDDRYWLVSDLYLIRPDGTGLHPLTVEGETVGHGTDDFPRFGLVPNEFSADGTRLAACVALELGGCEPVLFTVSNGPGRKLDIEQVFSARLAPDGRSVLFESGVLDDEEHHTLSVIPFEGGTPRIVIRNAARGCWAPAPRTKDDTA